MQAEKKYDYIIAGAGAAGLSLLVRLLISGNFNSKKILLIDKEIKLENDRTWCFWEKENGLFQSIVKHEWTRLKFYSDTFNSKLNIEPYSYKMIRSEDFYSFCFDIIHQHENVTIVCENILEMVNISNLAIVRTELNSYSSQFVFNSTVLKKIKKQGRYNLLQHFKGYVIQSDIDLFDASSATLMDFRIDQINDTRFVYVLPFNKNSALIEYTVFSENIIESEEYDCELKKYIASFITKSHFEIKETEFGIIPMTDTEFKSFDGNIYNIGIAGGLTKASTGYTFQFIQKYSDTIVDCLFKNDMRPLQKQNYTRFNFYDAVLLYLLQTHKVEAKEIFSRMFKYNRAADVLAFLENKSFLTDELKMFSFLPVKAFSKAALKIILQKIWK